MDIRRDKKLVVALGDYGAGKTTFAKWYAKNNGGLFIDSDLLLSDEPGTFEKRLAATIESSPKRLFIMDGCQDVGKLPQLEDSLSCNVRLCLCFAAPHIIRKRQELKAGHVKTPLPFDEIMIKSRTESFHDMTTKNSLFVDTTDGYHFVSWGDWPQRWQELLFYSELSKLSQDKQYQDIELPSGLILPGYTRPNESWERLKTIDIKGKDALDIGCLYGHFSFKAEEAGARSVLGIDIDEKAIGIARRVAQLRKSRVRFSCGNITDFESDNIYDVVFVLNMLHRTGNTEQALRNIFRIGKLVVFEIYVAQESIVLEFAEQFGHELRIKMTSHRFDREIAVLSQDPITQKSPATFRYNYRAEYRKKLLRVMIAKVSKIKILYPLVWLVRKYRKIRKSKVLFACGC